MKRQRVTCHITVDALSSQVVKQKPSKRHTTVCRQGTSTTQYLVISSGQEYLFCSTGRTQH